MYFKITLFSVITLIYMSLTVWLMVARTRGRVDSNWPLVYYFLVLVYWRAFEGALNPYWVYAGVVSAALLRFEFLGGVVLTFVRVIEYFFLAYMFARGLQLILLWPW